MIRIAAVREFRDHATKILKSRDPILVLRRSEVAGIFFPYPEKSLPLELKRELFDRLSSSIAKRLKSRGVTEKEILSDFESWRRKRRAARRRR